MKNIDRRQFLGQASCAGLGYLTFMNSLLNLKSINASAISNSAVNGFNDYKAIVCVLLAGGNDSYNMLMPYDTTHHNNYINSRSGLIANGGLAIPQGDLTATRINQVFPGSREFATHPSMGGIRNLVDNGRGAFLTNIGTKLRPDTTNNNYNAPNHSPIGLFSHADQIQQWQTGIPNQRLAKGWGGKVADLIGDCNSNNSISMNVSLSGSNIFQTGNNTIEYAIGPDGAVGMNGFDPSSSDLYTSLRTNAIDSLIGHTYTDIFKQTYMDVVGDAKEGFLQFQNALTQAITFDENEFPGSYLASQLEMIARTIDIRNVLGFKRQIFFITVGGWDHHDEVIENQNGMLGFVSDAIAKFYEVLGANYTDVNNQTQPGVNIEDNVLTMFISEFGRTLTSNGNGSDHAWGGNSMAFGGPNLMNSGKVYGNYPRLNPAHADDMNIALDYGRYIPTLSTDQYFAEAAKWFGVPNSDLTTIFPNLTEFWSPDGGLPIGFINNSAV